MLVKTTLAFFCFNLNILFCFFQQPFCYNKKLGFISFKRKFLSIKFSKRSQADRRYRRGRHPTDVRVEAWRHGSSREGREKLPATRKARWRTRDRRLRQSPAAGSHRTIRRWVFEFQFIILFYSSPNTKANTYTSMFLKHCTIQQLLYIKLMSFY